MLTYYTMTYTKTDTETGPFETPELSPEELGDFASYELTENFDADDIVVTATTNTVMLSFVAADDLLVELQGLNWITDRFNLTVIDHGAA